MGSAGWDPRSLGGVGPREFAVHRLPEAWEVDRRHEPGADRDDQDEHFREVVAVGDAGNHEAHFVDNESQADAVEHGRDTRDDASAVVQSDETGNRDEQDAGRDVVGMVAEDDGPSAHLEDVLDADEWRRGEVRHPDAGPDEGDQEAHPHKEASVATTGPEFATDNTRQPCQRTRPGKRHASRFLAFPYLNLR
jgi:hypothetical protein